MRNLPEITDFGFEVSSKKNILRFEVSMDDLRVAFMHEVYCLGDVEQYPHFYVERSFFLEFSEKFFNILLLAELGDYKHVFVRVDCHSDDHYNVGVSQLLQACDLINYETDLLGVHHREFDFFDSTWTKFKISVKDLARCTNSDFFPKVHFFFFGYEVIQITKYCIFYIIHIQVVLKVSSSDYFFQPFKEDFSAVFDF